MAVSADLPTSLQLFRGKVMEALLKKSFKSHLLEGITQAGCAYRQKDFSVLSRRLMTLAEQIQTEQQVSGQRGGRYQPLLNELNAIQCKLNETLAQQPPPDQPNPQEPPTVPAVPTVPVTQALATAFGYFFTYNGDQLLEPQQEVLFTTNGPATANINHIPGQAAITISCPGVYQVAYALVTTETDSLFELCINGSPLPGTRFRQSGKLTNPASSLVALGLPGNLTVKNVGPATRLLAVTPEGSRQVNAAITLLKIA